MCPVVARLYTLNFINSNEQEGMSAQLQFLLVRQNHQKIEYRFMQEHNRVLV
jgi:hypothetical protein